MIVILALEINMMFLNDIIQFNVKTIFLNAGKK